MIDITSYVLTRTFINRRSPYREVFVLTECRFFLSIQLLRTYCTLLVTYQEKSSYDNTLHKGKEYER